MRFFKKTVLLSLVTLFFLIPITALAAKESPSVEKKSEYVGRVELEDKKYPYEHYRMETQVDDGLKATGDRALAGINNGLWSINKQITSFTLFAVEQLMTFNLINMVVNQASILSSNIFNSMSSTFMGLFVVIAGGTAAYRYFVNQKVGQAVKALIGVIVILTATFWFFGNTKANITWFNNLSSDIEGIAASTNVILTTDKVNSEKPYDQQEGTAVLRNQLFNLMVKQPYLFLNYGTTKESVITKKDANRVDKLLALKPYQEEGKNQREDIVDKEVKDKNTRQMTTDYSGERFGSLFLTIFSTIAIAVPVLLLAGLKFLVQLFFLAALIFTGIPLVMSLLPTYSETALNHFKHLMTLVFYKAALVLLIAVTTGIGTLIYEGMKVTGGLEGYMLVVFTTALTMVGLYKYRNNIMEVASAGYIQGNQAADRITQSTSQTLQNTANKGMDYVERIIEKKKNNQNNMSNQPETMTGNDSQRANKRFAVLPGGKSQQSDKRQSANISNNSSKPNESRNKSDKPNGVQTPLENKTNAKNSQINGQKANQKQSDKRMSDNQQKSDSKTASSQSMKAPKQNTMQQSELRNGKQPSTQDNSQRMQEKQQSALRDLKGLNEKPTQTAKSQVAAGKEEGYSRLKQVSRRSAKRMNANE